MSFEHSSNSVEFYTPPSIINDARKVMTTIGFDPFTSKAANQIVQAGSIFTKDDNAFAHFWKADAAICNPPGGTDSTLRKEYGTSSVQAAGFLKLYQHWKAGDISEAIFVGFNSSVVHVAQEILNLPICYLNRRIRFWCNSEDIIHAESAKNSPNIPKVSAYVKKCKDDPELHVELGFGKYLVPTTSPKYNTVIAYLPPGIVPGPAYRHCAYFAEVFSKYGKVVIPS